MLESDFSGRLAAVEAGFSAHQKFCDRRYEEEQRSRERLFAFIKEAHTENRKDISEIKDTLSEQRGAGKATKIIGSVLVAGLSLVAGYFGGHTGR